MNNKKTYNMNYQCVRIGIGFVLFSFLTGSCLKPDLYKKENKNEEFELGYIYPFKNEVRNVVAEITVETDGTCDLEVVDTEIPFLKYNKSLLFLLAQDDCKHAAYSCTWAAIHGKPLSAKYYYSTSQLVAGDLPPDAYYLGKTLGSTDGAGHEVRFAFTTTLSPEMEWMNKKADIQMGFTGNYYRFFMKSGLSWDDVVEMLNYGTGIAFHNVETENEEDIDSVRLHYDIAQKIILDKLSGRGCKFLAEPDGNKTYVTAAQGYASIQIMTAQAGAETLYPFKVKDDLKKKLINRVFYPNDQFKEAVESQMKLSKEDRKVVYLGAHGTDSSFANLLLWLNDTYGKDGDDVVWFPNTEEYYEYNYYRIHSSVKKEVHGNQLKLIINLPAEEYFYYPSITLNVKGLRNQNIKSISSSSSVTGLSYADFEGNVMLI